MSSLLQAAALANATTTTTTSTTTTTTTTSSPFPQEGVHIECLKSVANSPKMNQPMVQLARPDLTVSNIDHMNSKELRSLAKELRVNSHMNGKDEFSTYDDASIPNDEWKALIRSPPTTTTHVNICIIKPMTKKGDGSPNGSYARRVQQESPQLHYVGKPTDFISHAWRYNFVDLVRAVESEADGRDRARAQRGLKPIKNERYYWNDIFVEDQNATMDKPEGYFFTAFREAIVSIGRTVLIYTNALKR